MSDRTYITDGVGCNLCLGITEHTPECLATERDAVPPGQGASWRAGVKAAKMAAQNAREETIDAMAAHLFNRFRGCFHGDTILTEQDIRRILATHLHSQTAMMPTETLDVGDVRRAVQLPPMPVSKDFLNGDGYCNFTLYMVALDAWKNVVNQLLTSGVHIESKDA